MQVKITDIYNSLFKTPEPKLNVVFEYKGVMLLTSFNPNIPSDMETQIGNKIKEHEEYKLKQLAEHEIASNLKDLIGTTINIKDSK
jgi:hypothetical protein